jgi:hypothetical protein
MHRILYLISVVVKKKAEALVGRETHGRWWGEAPSEGMYRRIGVGACRRGQKRIGVRACRGEVYLTMGAIGYIVGG